MLEELAAGQVTLATVWLLGVSMGLTACTVTCLPFMGTWALGRASGQREAFLHTGVFLAGRVTTYTVLAALAGAVGLGLAQALGGTWGNAVIGGASILAGLWLLAKPAGKACGAVLPAPTFQTVRFQRKADTLPPLFLGAALSLTPCTPLASLLALAANAGSAIEGASFGLAFGVG
ncbi:MAG: sulfite exporter TauE/SafE family protein, partial [Rhodocyclaceae bacterium]|nr:sulfite exporter TauE/SafE family protein [Rhodocyclaceae bacterium]